MSEKLNSHSGNEDVKTKWDMLTESEAREHGITINAKINDSGRDGFSEKEWIASHSAGKPRIEGPSWSEKEWLESHSAGKPRIEGPSWSEKEWLELQASMPSDEDVEAEHQRRTGASIEAVQNMSDNAAKGIWSGKERANEILDVLEQEPDSVRAVIERRARSTLSDFSEGGRSFTFNPDKVYSDLTFIDAAIERGNVDVSEMRIDPEPLMHLKPQMIGVGKMLDRMSNELSSKATMRIKDPNNPDQTIDVKEYISDIRSTIKDTSEAPVEQPVAEQPKAEAPENKAREEQIDAAREAVMARIQAEQNKRNLGQQISETRRALAQAEEELKSQQPAQKSGGLFKRFSKRESNPGNSAAAEKVQELTTKLAALEQQGKDIGIL